MDPRELRDAQLRRERRERLFDPSTRTRIEQLELPLGARCLEVGAGHGSIATWLAGLPQTGEVVATDLRPEYLGALRPLVSRGVEVWEHDITRDELPQSAFDLVHARFVLEHLPSRDDVVVRLASALTPGGWLLIEDAEFSTCEVAESRPYRKAMAAFSAAMALTGTDYTWSSLLPTRLWSAGLRRVSGTGEVRWFAGGSEEASFWAANLIELRDRYVRAGLLDEAELHEVLDELADATGWFPSPMTVIAAGQRGDHERPERETR